MATSDPAQDATPDTAQPAGHRAHRFIVPTLLVVATVLTFAGAFAIWVNRQALNTDHWTTTSGRVLANKKVQTALSAYLVNEIFTKTDVAAEIRKVLPTQAQALAGPAAAGAEELAGRIAPKILARPRVQDAWVSANRFAHTQLLRILKGGGPVLSTQQGVVTLNLHALVAELGKDLGIQDQVQTVQQKLQSSAGQTAKGVAEQKLGITLPPSSGKLVIMKSDQLSTAQSVAQSVKGLAYLLPALAFVLFALAIFLARGRRRRALRTTGWCFVGVGLLLLVLRRVGGNEIVDSLVKVPSNEPAVHEVWTIATSLLYTIATATIIYGLAMVVAAWLAGHTRPAGFLRRSAAPVLRDQPVVAYAVAGGIFLLLVAWGPTPAFRNIGGVILLGALLAFGVAMLRREVGREFPDVAHGDAMRELRGRWEDRRARRAARTTPPAAPPAPAAASRVDELERLIAHHDRGDLTDAEFAAQKANLVPGNGG